MNRFVKDNRGLIAAIIAGAIAALGLLIVAVIGYVNMAVQVSRTNKLRDDIQTLNKQKPAPVDGNKAPLQEDIALYSRAAAELRRNYGRPYQEAIDRFITIVMQDKDGETLEEKTRIFKEAYEEQVNSVQQFAEQSMKMQSFSRQYPHWQEAVDEFIKIAGKLTQEPDIENHKEEFVLGALGFPRKMQGKADQMGAFLEKYRVKLNSIIGEKLGTEAEDFGLLGKNGQVNYPAADYPNIIRHMDIIGDLVFRISKSGVSMLNEFSVRIPGQAAQENNGLGPMGGGPEAAGDTPKLDGSFTDNGAFKVAHYTFEVTGSMSSIRQLARELDAAVAVRRVYVVRSIFLYAPSIEAERAKQLIAPSGVAENDENPDAANIGVAGRTQSAAATPARRRRGAGADPAVPGRTGNRRRAGEAGLDPAGEESGVSEEERRRQAQIEAARKFRERQAQLPFYERFGYAEVQFGGTFDCRAVFDVDYVMLNQ